MRPPYLGIGAVYLALVVALEAISAVGLYRHAGITPWNPAAGLSVAAAYLGGIQFAPYVFVSHAVGRLLDANASSSGLHVLSAIAVGATYFGAGLALRRWPGFERSLSTVNDCLRLFVVAVVTGGLASLLQVSGSLAAGLVAPDQLLAVYWRSHVGSLVGILTVAPLVLMLARMRSWTWLTFEQVVQLATVFIVALVIFLFPAATAYQLFYLLFIPVLWVALRFGIVGSIVVLNLCQIAIIVGAQITFGFRPGLAPLQTLLVVLVATGLLVGAVVTERQASAQRIREQHAALNKALRLRSAGETAAAIAHEINQPLTAAGTYAGIIDTALARGDTDLARETAVKLRAQCDRAAAVVASIRALVSQGSLSQESVDVSELVDDLSQLHRDELSAKGVSLSTDIPRDLRLMVDPTQMQQALHNLINNSIQAIAGTGRRGAITIAARVGEDNSAVLEVRDNGPGFPQGFEELAATPFMTTKQNGSGLGLAVARSVAEAHGGSLVIEPTGYGAVVRLRLPVLSEVK